MHDDNSKIHSPHNLEGLAWPLNEHENPQPDSGQDTYLSSKKYEESGYGLNLDVLTISCSVIREIFGHNHWLRSILVYAKSNRLHVDILRFHFMKLGYIK